jgi:hypothetical protein
VDVGRRRQHRLDLLPGQAAQVLEELAVEGVGGRHHQLLPLLLQRQDRVLAGERARQGAGDELGVQLERIDLAVVQPGRVGHRQGGLVLVDQLTLVADVGEAEGGQQLDGRELGPPQAPTPGARGLLPKQPGPLHVLAGEGGAPRVVADDAGAGQGICNVLEGEVGGAAGGSHDGSLYRAVAAASNSRVARPGDVQMLQPTGPQAGTWPPPPPGLLVRVAAGRDSTRETRVARQVGQATSSGSDLRITRTSKILSQAGQAYS